ncbi:hypothetical protein N0V90_012121 [Kalmusia sp. IMI 367209]|nr:hypothetical protein N0V90_012121 [Kalmusia sp. IMI 367209]
MNDKPSSNVPRAVFATTHEKQQGVYSASNLQKALEALNQDGLVVLKGLVDTAHVDALNDYMSSKTDEIVNNMSNYNHGVPSNILQSPPLTDATYLYEDLYFNPFIMQLANAYLGPRPVFNFLKGNTALRNTSALRQPVHKDVRFHHPQCPFYFIANIPLCDFNVENGATEFWLGSHATTNGSDQVSIQSEVVDQQEGSELGELKCDVRPELCSERKLKRPPIQVNVARGDVVIRDIRLWHAGMPNASKNHRIMIALGYQIKAAWYPNFHVNSTLPLSQAHFFLKPRPFPVEVRANIVSNEEVEKMMHCDNFDLRPTQ